MHQLLEWLLASSDCVVFGSCRALPSLIILLGLSAWTLRRKQQGLHLAKRHSCKCAMYGESRAPVFKRMSPYTAPTENSFMASKIVVLYSPCSCLQAVVSNASVWDTLGLVPEGPGMPDLGSWRRERASTPPLPSFMHLHVGFDATGERACCCQVFDSY